jgi:hypothetical protein
MSDNYETDEWIAALFPFSDEVNTGWVSCAEWYDPCPLGGPLGDDPRDSGLHGDHMWGDRAFVNPPYSNPRPWVQRAIKEAKGGTTVVMLLKHDSSTKWYQDLVEAGARFLMIGGRLNYRTGKSAPFPSVLAVLMPL